MQRRGKSDVLSHDLVARAFADHLKEFNAWHAKRPDVAILRVSYTRVLQDPVSISQEIKSFLNLDLNTDAMAQQVDPALYRNRRP
jgi:hypothetical protein